MTKQDFAEFVEKQFKNDPALMVNHFYNEIETVAELACVDWSSTEDNVPIEHGVKVSTASLVKMTDKNFRGRGFVNVYVNQYKFIRTQKGNAFTEPKKETIHVPFPVIQFGNLSKSGTDSTWSALGSLWEEYKESESQAGFKSAHHDVVEQIKKKEKRKKENLLARQKDEVNIRKKDINWYRSLEEVTSASRSAYFDCKGASTIHEQIRMVRGVTTNRETNEKAIFYGLPVFNVDGRIKLMQRYYETGKHKVRASKRFRKGVDPSGGVIPFGMFSNGEPIYIMEQAASASLANRLLGCAAISYLFVDNAPQVVTALIKRFPDSQFIHVRDDDASGEVNAGKQIHERLKSIVGGQVCEHAAPFSEQELKNGNSDLSDFWCIYGDDATRQFLLSI